MRAPGDGRSGRIAVEGPVVEPLGLEEDHRIIILDARDQQALGIVRIRRHHHFDAADVSKNPFRTLRMRLPAADAAAAGRANGHRCEELAGAAIADARQFAADLIEARIDVVRELNLGDRAQSVHAHADRGGDDAALGDGGVDDAVFAVLALQPFRGAKYAAEITDVLAHEHHRRIPLQHDVHGRIQGLDHVHVGHGS